MTEAELEDSIARDPDWDGIPSDWHLKAEAVMPVGKKLVSVRFDTDVLEWFKNQGSRISDPYECRSARFR